MAQLVINVRETKEVRCLARGRDNQVHARIGPVVAEPTGDAERRLMRIADFLANPIDQEAHQVIFGKKSLQRRYRPPFERAHKFRNAFVALIMCLPIGGIGQRRIAGEGS